MLRKENAQGQNVRVVAIDLVRVGFRGGRRCQRRVFAIVATLARAWADPHDFERIPQSGDRGFPKFKSVQRKPDAGSVGHLEATGCYNPTQHFPSEDTDEFP